MRNYLYLSPIKTSNNLALFWVQNKLIGYFCQLFHLFCCPSLDFGTMRSFISPVLLTLAALTTLSAATFTSTCVAEICGESSFEARAVHSTPTRAVENRALTNAQRLSLGLPLKSPARRRSRGKYYLSPFPTFSSNVLVC